MNTPALNKHFSVNNLYDNAPTKSRLLQLGTVCVTEERCHGSTTALALSCTAGHFTSD